MDSINTSWLPHLHTDVVSEIEGNYLDSYVVAIEGWRRGLTLKWHVKDSELFKDLKTWYVDQPGQLFSLHAQDREHYFFRTRGDKVTNEAVELGMDKVRTKELLQSKNLSVPEGRAFKTTTDIKKIIKYADKIGYPIVIKATDDSFGRGVFSNISNAEELNNAYEQLKGNEKAQVIVEQFIDGKDYRLYVVGDEVVGAILRIPPNIIGDGVSTIDQLIKRKNQLREPNPRLSNCPITVNKEMIDFISKQNYMLSSVIEKGKLVYLSDKANVSIGGDPIDVLDELSDETKALAVNTLKAIGGIGHGAVDIMTETKNGKEQGYVLEINPTAQIGGILFPLRGKPRDVPKAIIDYYFPETKDVYSEKEKIYFEFYDVLDPLISRQSTITTVTPAPLGKIYMKKYIAFGEVQDQGYQNGLRKQAFERNLHGHIIKGDSDEIEIIVAGQDEEMVKDYKNGITEDEERAVVNKIIEEDFHGYFHVGFDSRLLYRIAEKRLKELKVESGNAIHEVRKLEKEKASYLRSKSWIITYPIRLLGKFKK